MWKIIFEAANLANCQIFAVTHSKGWIESFSSVAECYDHENMKYINLSRNVDTGKIVLTVMDSLRLGDPFSLGLDVR
jgi:hypothetical protein